MTDSFDIISYMRSLTGYQFDTSVLERIAMEREATDAMELSDLTQRQKDLIRADLLFVLYTSPSESASISKKHGSFAQTIGSQRITDKDNIYALMMKLYKKWDDPMLDMIPDEGYLYWLE